MNLKSKLGQLQLLAILEGISYISFGLTMPLKYLMGIKGPNYIVGMAHGLLFMAYCLWVLIVHFDRKLSLKNTALLLIASLIPFMTFWAEKKLLKPLQINDVN
jgi:integral membrane protein